MVEMEDNRLELEPSLRPVQKDAAGNTGPASASSCATAAVGFAESREAFPTSC